MFYAGDEIDKRYIIEGVCSDEGGMGVIYFVKPVNSTHDFKMVMKYCKNLDDESVDRFRREVRLLESFAENSRVVQIVSSNLKDDTPYFVMKYYNDGDLLRQAKTQDVSLEKHEQNFLQMIDCIQELHSKNIFHRDIKPQNFLLDGDHIVVSDFGLSTEVGSGTAFTRSSAHWGTHDYMPPEFMDNGFKNADATSDIFMLGKTFYALLTKSAPKHIVEENIPTQLYHIVERCCSISKKQRYQSLADLRQSVVAAFEVLLDRADGVGKVKQLLSAIIDRIEQEGTFNEKHVFEFVEQLSILDESEQIKICQEIKADFFEVIHQKSVSHCLQSFLAVYEKLIDWKGYSWSYAEIIAKNMQIIFSGNDAPIRDRVRALDLAIRASCYMDRYAAMDTCREMITSIDNETLGFPVAELIKKHSESFVGGIEPVACNSVSIANALKKVKKI